MKTVKVFLGLLTGFAVGALTGMLFAPEKGSKTKEGLLEKGEDYSDALKEKFDGLFKVITKQFEQVKTEVSHYAEKEKEKAEKIENSSGTAS